MLMIVLLVKCELDLTRSVMIPQLDSLDSFRRNCDVFKVIRLLSDRLENVQTGRTAVVFRV